MSILSLYKWTTILTGPFIRLFLTKRKRSGKEHPTRYKERRGYASIPRPQGKLIWLHAASVGEAMSSLALIDALLATDGDLHVLQTTGTVTSAAVMETKLPDRVIHQFVPVDRPKWVKRFIKHWQPDLSIWLESELWPNLITQTAIVGKPLVLVNGRMSEKSFQKWKKFPSLASNLLGSFDLCMGQSDKDSARFAALGATPVISPGNLKLAAQPLSCDAEKRHLLQNMVKGRPLWLAASTHPGEERIMAEAHVLLRKKHPDLLTIIAPRHPDRADVIETDLTSMGLKVSRRSTGAGANETKKADIYLADTLGELGLFYRLSDIIFLGGTLGADVGGHNPVEPAQLNCAIIRGGDMSNFMSFAKALDGVQGSTVVEGPKSLSVELDRLLSDPEILEMQIAASKKFADEGGAVLDHIMQALLPFVTTDKQ